MNTQKITKQAERWVFLNGKFYLEKEAAIPVTDRGFLFGEGVFTTIRLHQGKCELLKNHIQRLQQHAYALDIEMFALTFEWIAELIQRNEAWEGTWRLKVIVTAKGEAKKRQPVGCFFAILDPYLGASVLDPCSLCLFPYPIASPLSSIKSLSYLDHLYVRKFAQQEGYADAITRTPNGILLETGCSNLFWIEQGICWIIDPHLCYLQGIFLQALLACLPLPIRWAQITLEQLPAKAHVYVCNALTHVRPVVAIEHRQFSRSKAGENLLQRATARALRGNESVVYAKPSIS